MNILKINIAGTLYELEIEQQKNGVWVVTSNDNKILNICEKCFGVKNISGTHKKNTKNSFCRFAYVYLLIKYIKTPIENVANIIGCSKRNVYYCRQQAENLFGKEKFFTEKVNHIIAICSQEGLI